MPAALPSILYTNRRTVWLRWMVIVLLVNYVVGGATLCGADSSGSENYPRYFGPNYAVREQFDFDGPLGRLYPEFKEMIKDKRGNVRDQRPSASQYESLLRRAETGITERIWPLVGAENRMKLPNVLMHGHEINSSSAYLPQLCYLTADETEQDHMTAFSLWWHHYLRDCSQDAFQIMAERSVIEEVNSLDTIILWASLSDWPGGTELSIRPNKAHWAIMHASENPCYRLLALEFFTAVDQSPSELLALYRECLFGACSYLETRALRAISITKDYRTEVQKLLLEYAASNPIFSDGTASHLRTDMVEPKQTALKLASMLAGEIAQHGESPPISLVPKNMAPPRSDKNGFSRPMQSGARFVRNSIGLIIIGITVIVLAVLWLWKQRQRKRRGSFSTTTSGP